MEEVTELKSILQKYELKSGQAINFQKSGIYFSANVRVDKQLEIKSRLGVFNDLSESKYLGLPPLIGKSKRRTFNFLKDRLRKKIEGWKVKCLSKAGKAILIQSVAQAVPSYIMSCFLIPKSLCKELEIMMNSFWWGSKDNSRRGIHWMSWANMSKAKCLGGMGFRDLHGFNLALLGKQCWNFMNKPNSLVARIFKARYFANCNLFEAQRGGGSSYIWSSLWQAKEQLKKGFKWVIGDGKMIRVFEDPWVRGKDNFMVDEAVSGYSRDLKVCDLFIPGTKHWDVNKVNNLLSSCDVSPVLTTPIPQNQVSDHLAWTRTVDGKYTAKSGYSYWFNQTHGIRRNEEQKGWTRLWNLRIPGKVKIFLWRICKNNVPVRYLLRNKGVHVTINCPMCLTDVEHMIHIFFECQFAQSCWEGMGFHFDMSGVEYCAEWLLKLLNTETSERLERIGSTLWGIWHARNLKVWEGKTTTPALAMQWSTLTINQWQEAQKMKAVNTGGGHNLSSSFPLRWVAPTEGRLKVNVDASVTEGGSSFSLGMIVRDHNGDCCRARTMCCEGVVSVFEAETKGVLEAIKWAAEGAISNVTFETDSMLTFQAITKGTMNYLEVGNMLEDCRKLLKDRPDFSLEFVKKQANKVAHSLARVPCEIGCFIDFLSPPQLVLENIMYDAALIE